MADARALLHSCTPSIHAQQNPEAGLCGGLCQREEASVCVTLHLQTLVYKHLGSDLKGAPENPLPAKYQVSLCIKSHNRKDRVGANRPLPPRHLPQSSSTRPRIGSPSMASWSVPPLSEPAGTPPARRRLAPSLTVSFLWSSMQWAAVSTQELWISTAPQASFFFESSRMPCNGGGPIKHSLPTTPSQGSASRHRPSVVLKPEAPAA